MLTNQELIDKYGKEVIESFFKRLYKDVMNVEEIKEGDAFYGTAKKIILKVQGHYNEMDYLSNVTIKNAFDYIFYPQKSNALITSKTLDELTLYYDCNSFDEYLETDKEIENLENKIDNDNIKAFEKKFKELSLRTSQKVKVEVDIEHRVAVLLNNNEEGLLETLFHEIKESSAINTELQQKIVTFFGKNSKVSSPFEKVIIYAIVISNIADYDVSKTNLLSDLYEKVHSNNKELVLLGISLSLIIHFKTTVSTERIHIDKELFEKINTTSTFLLSYLKEKETLNKITVITPLIEFELESITDYFVFDEQKIIDRLIEGNRINKSTKNFIREVLAKANIFSSGEKNYLLKTYLIANEEDSSVLISLVSDSLEGFNFVLEPLNFLKNIYIFMYKLLSKDLFEKTIDINKVSTRNFYKFLGNRKYLIDYYLKIGDIKEAKLLLNKCTLALDDLDEDFLVYKAQILFANKEEEEALKLFPIYSSKYSFLDPLSKPKKQTYNVLTYLNLLWDRDKLYENVNCLCILGNIYKEISEYKLAELHYKKALEKAPKSIASEYLKRLENEL